MFSVTDFKASISSFEFSLFLESSPRFCPNCRHLLENDFLTEVRLSSLVLLLGVGSIVCYKWLTETHKKKKSPFALSKTMNQNKETKESNKRRHKMHKMLSSTPFLILSESWETTPSLISSESSSDLFLNSTDFIDENDISMGKTPFDGIGNNTVAKLDELLQQIKDIKQSVYDIDEQIFDVKDSNIKFEPKMFSLEPDMSSSINTESDLNEKFILSTEPQTPTLEWDLMDLNGFDANNGHNFDSISDNQLMSQLNNHSINGNKSLTEILKSSSTLEDLSSPTISTSGEFSISSPSEELKENNSAIVQKMISEAKRLGLLKDLIHILVKNSKRDSAYFED